MNSARINVSRYNFARSQMSDKPIDKSANESEKCTDIDSGSVRPADTIIQLSLDTEICQLCNYVGECPYRGCDIHDVPICMQCISKYRCAKCE